MLSSLLTLCWRAVSLYWTIPEVTINNKDEEGVDKVGHEGYSGQGKEELPGQQVIDHTSISWM